MKSRHFILILICTVLTSSFVWVRLQIVSISYDIHELQSKEKILRDDVNNLSLKTGELRSPHNLEAIARSKFQMQAPSSDQIVVLKDNP